jgi:hypothetical protein
LARFFRCPYTIVAGFSVRVPLDNGYANKLDQLALGKPILAPEGVGLVPEFGETEAIRRYPAGEREALVRLVTACYEEKLARSRLVQERTWDRWAQAHHHLFMQLLESRQIALPRPAIGFRFGMMSELEVPLRIDVGPLEEGIDLVARRLFFGQYAEARGLLKGLVGRYPCAERLLETTLTALGGRWWCIGRCSASRRGRRTWRQRRVPRFALGR